MSGFDDKCIRSFEARLVARQGELADLVAASKVSRKAVELDQTRVGRLSRMDALQDQAMAQETNRRRGLELRRIEAAFKRLQAGEFGYCVSCGEDIALKRLQLDPTASQCIDCAD